MKFEFMCHCAIALCGVVWVCQRVELDLDTNLAGKLFGKSLLSNLDNTLKFGSNCLT